MDMNTVSLTERWRLTLCDDEEDVMSESASEPNDDFPLDDRFDSVSSVE
jgi:hypothetical protein